MSFNYGFVVIYASTPYLLFIKAGNETLMLFFVSIHSKVQMRADILSKH